VVGVAHQADSLVTPLAQHPFQPQRDLAVSSGDNNSHDTDASRTRKAAPDRRADRNGLITGTK